MKNYFKIFKFAIKETIKAAPLFTVLLAIIIFVNSQIPFITSKISSEIINKLIDYVKVPNSNIQPLIMMALLWALSESVQSLFNRFRSYLSNSWGYKMALHQEKKDINHMVGLDLGRIESKSFQDLKQRSGRKGMWPINEVFNYFLNIIGPIAVIITSAIIIGYLDWRIYLIIIVTVIPQIMIGIKYGRKSFGIWSSDNGQEQRIYHQFKSFMTSIWALPEIKRWGASSFFINKTDEIFRKTTEKLEKNEGERFKKYMWAEIVSAIGFVAIIFVLLNHVLDGTILIGTFLFYSQTIDKLSGAIMEIFVGISYQEENIQLTKELIEYFDIKPLITTTHQVKLDLKNTAPEIIFDKVSFKYPDTTRYVLKDVSFKISPGERVGLIGINGAGKTTIVKLLQRDYDPTEGNITMNGINLKNVDPKELFTYISSLMQDYNLYHALTVNESFIVSNYSKTQVLDEKRMKLSGKKSKADEFIGKWKDKYDNMIGKAFGGEEMSRGQAQKMALARAFYREAPIMILDEPTAAIDAESEIEIFEELEKIPRTVSILYISHDMATIKKADRIMLIEDGKIVENGNHDELIEKDKHYARIYNAQLNNLTKATS